MHRFPTCSQSSSRRDGRGLFLRHLYVTPRVTPSPHTPGLQLGAERAGRRSQLSDKAYCPEGPHTRSPKTSQKAALLSWLRDRHSVLMEAAGLRRREDLLSVTKPVRIPLPFGDTKAEPGDVV